MFAKRKIMAVLVAISLLAVVGCGSSEVKKEPGQASQTPQAQSGQYVLNWGTIGSGGTWNVLGNAMLQDIIKANPNISGSCVPSSTAATVMGVNAAKYNIGFTMTDTTADGWNGEGQFKEQGKLQDVRNIASFYPAGTHFIVPKDSKITKIEDLKGKKVSPMTKGSSCDLEFQRLLQLYGMSYKDMDVQFLTYDDGAQQFIDGHLDALVYLTGSIPSPVVINVMSQREIKIISLPDEKIKEMTKYMGVMEYTIPPGTYTGIDYPIKGVGSYTHLIVTKDMPDDVAYSIVKTIYENFARYQEVISNMKFCKPEEMGLDTGITMHPGALKFYKEKGLIK